jgi:hypothetical protein
MQGALQALEGGPPNTGYILKKDPIEELRMREQQKEEYKKMLEE